MVGYCSSNLAISKFAADFGGAPDVGEGDRERPRLDIGTTAWTEIEEDEDALDSGMRLVDGVEDAEDADERAPGAVAFKVEDGAVEYEVEVYRGDRMTFGVMVGDERFGVGASLDIRLDG